MALQTIPGRVYRFVRSPRTFFRESTLATNPAVGAVVVLSFVFALAWGMWYLGELFAAATDATVTMDNPERPPDWMCDDVGGTSGAVPDQGCDEPETVERDAGAILREAVRDYVGMVAVVGLLFWPIAGVVLFVAARIAGGTGSFLPTLAVAAWGVVPEFVRLIAGLVGLRYVLGRATFTGPVESLPGQVTATLAPLDVPLTVVTLFVLGWQWIVLTAGIEDVHGLSRPAAGTAVGIPLAFWGIFFALS